MQDRRCVCVFLPNDDTLNVIVNVSTSSNVFQSFAANVLTAFSLAKVVLFCSLCYPARIPIIPQTAQL